MEPLKNMKSLLQGATKDVRNDLLCSSFVFPRTESLKDSKPCMEFTSEVNGELDWEKMKEYIQQNTEAIALNARGDLLLIVDMMEEVSDEVILDKFDQILIFRGGLNLLRIKTGNTPSGRSVFVEINDYRRKINSFFTQQPNYIPTLFLGVFLGAVSAYLYSAIHYRVG